MNEKQKVIIKSYSGDERQATASFKNEARKLAKQGYYPTSQNYVVGSYGCGSFLIAAILCFIIIGIFVFIYMLVVKPDGVLNVTYELKEDTQTSTKNTLTSDSKQCPMCAEDVKLAAKICRYCSHKFDEYV